MSAALHVAVDLAVLLEWHTTPGSSKSWVFGGLVLLVFSTALRMRLAWVRDALISHLCTTASNTYSFCCVLPHAVQLDAVVGRHARHLPSFSRASRSGAWMLQRSAPVLPACCWWASTWSASCSSSWRCADHTFSSGLHWTARVPMPAAPPRSPVQFTVLRKAWAAAEDGRQASETAAEYSRTQETEDMPCGGNSQPRSRRLSVREATFARISRARIAVKVFFQEVDDIIDR